MKQSDIYLMELNALSKAMEKNAMDFKQGKLTYEELHAVQYPLSKRIDELRTLIENENGAG